MRIYIQQFDSGRARYFINVPIKTEQEKNKAFKKVYVNFWGCEPTTGNITPTKIELTGYKIQQETVLQDKITGNDVTVDIKNTAINLNIIEYTKTDKDLKYDEEDKARNKNYVKPPYNAEQIAKNKLNAYKKRKRQQEPKVETDDFMNLSQEDLGEMLPF